MNEKKPLAKKDPSDLTTRQVVEKAIDLSKQDKDSTWGSRAIQKRAQARNWEYSRPAEAP